MAEQQQKPGVTEVEIGARLMALCEQRNMAWDAAALSQGKNAVLAAQNKAQSEMLQKLLDQNTDLRNKLDEANKNIEAFTKDAKQPGGAKPKGKKATPAAA